MKHVHICEWFYTTPEGIRHPLKGVTEAKLAVSANWSVFGLAAGPGNFNPTPPLVAFLNEKVFVCLGGETFYMI